MVGLLGSLEYIHRNGVKQPLSTEHSTRAEFLKKPNEYFIKVENARH